MIKQPSHKNRVLIISHDVISTSMAGPGIRSLELARVLSEEFDVVLATPNDCELQEDGIRLHAYRYGNWEMLKGAFEGIDVIFATGFTLHEFPLVRALEIPIAIDLFDPFPLENLYIFEDADLEQKQLVHLTDAAIVDKMCHRGDFFICANARQRDWWLGVLQAKGRINFATVDNNPSLNNLIDEVPFGLPTRPFYKNGPGPKEQLRGVSPDDKLILWGGGLWNWLDPLTLIQAMPSILAQEPRAKLLFPGTRHPNSAVPRMKRIDETIALAEQLGLREQAVFFGDWVPYEEWTNYLADADVAVSLHFNTLETQFSAVRSRVLSYIWAGLPMVVTEGDAASRMVAQYELGEVVTYRDVDQVSQAILTVMSNSKTHYAANFEQVASQLTWHHVAQPLLTFCRAPQRAPDKVGKWAGVTQHMSIEEQKKQLQQQAEQLAHKEQKIAQQQHYLIQQEQRIKQQEERIKQQEQGIKQFAQLVQGYEQGKFITLMRHLDQLKRRICKRP
ncbi:MAG: glycosyltransferase [Ardenticatenaceae bacterium]